jgi:hypothetical protein
MEVGIAESRGDGPLVAGGESGAEFLRTADGGHPAAAEQHRIGAGMTEHRTGDDQMITRVC